MGMTKSRRFRFHVGSSCGCGVVVSSRRLFPYTEEPVAVFGVVGATTTDMRFLDDDSSTGAVRFIVCVCCSWWLFGSHVWSGVVGD
jgi:hypothetical protein